MQNTQSCEKSGAGPDKNTEPYTPEKIEDNDIEFLCLRYTNLLIRVLIESLRKFFFRLRTILDLDES